MVEKFNKIEPPVFLVLVVLPLLLFIMVVMQHHHEPLYSHLLNSIFIIVMTDIKER